MDARLKGAAKRLLLSLLVAGGLSGCVAYGPPYYDSYGYGSPYYSQPYYAGPPVTLDLGFGFYNYGHHHRGHGWRGHGHRGDGGFRGGRGRR